MYHLMYRINAPIAPIILIVSSHPSIRAFPARPIPFALTFSFVGSRNATVLVLFYTHRTLPEPIHVMPMPMTCPAPRGRRNIAHVSASASAQSLSIQCFLTALFNPLLPANPK